MLRGLLAHLKPCHHRLQLKRQQFQRKELLESLGTFTFEIGGYQEGDEVGDIVAVLTY